jgi:hypothetical protein
MKPKKVTAQSEREERRIEVCDLIISRAYGLMKEEAGADDRLRMDRFLTFIASQLVANVGREQTSFILGSLITDIMKSDAFDHLDTGGPRH